MKPIIKSGGYILLLLLCCACLHTLAQQTLITTIAGQPVNALGYGGYSGDGGPAINAKLNEPEGLCLDKWGNIYIADVGNNRVRKIDINTGIITTVAGIGPTGLPSGFSGDGGPATNAKIWLPCAVFTDTTGNVYIADAANARIRKITIATGIITTVAGNGTAGYSGDEIPATNAELNVPVGLCLDKHGNIYIADYNNNVVRKVSAATGIITTFAGNQRIGYTGDNGPATNATFQGPIEVFADSMDNIFICDQYNHAVRKVAASTGIITTIAGNGMPGYTGDNEPATNAQLNQPCGVYVDKQNNIFIAEYGDGVIRRIDGVSDIITTVAGTGVRGFSGDGGPATNAELKCGDVFLDDYGIVYIADEDNSRIRKVYNSTLNIASLGFSKRKEVVTYPNPVGEWLTVINATGDDFYIYDLLGKEIYWIYINSDKEQINMNTILSGVYMVRVVDCEGNIQNIKLVKE